MSALRVGDQPDVTQGIGARLEGVPAPTPCAVTLLGGFSLTVGGERVGVPVTIQRIVAFLALRGRCGRSRVAGALWPGTTELRALANLRTAIWRANQAVPGLVDAGHDSIALAARAEADVTALVRTAHDVLDGRAATRSDDLTLRQGEGDLLPDWDDEWLVVDRERLRQLRLHVLETAAAQLAAQGMFGMALEAALAALRADTLRESAHRAVIRIHLAEGNLAEAVAAYRRCCAVLAGEFGVAPSAETSRLVEHLADRLSAVG